LKLAKDPLLQNITEIVDKSNFVLSDSEISELSSDIYSELTGFGALSNLISKDVTDILVNDCESVWTDGSAGLQKHLGIFRDNAEVALLARRLASLCKMRLDDSKPFVDGLLPDGVRLHALIPPISGACAKISLRFPNSQTIPISQWIADLDSKSIELVDSVINGEASFVISGETGSGKTTLLKSILAAGNQKQRIILLEDSPEISLTMPNLVSLCTRKPNTEGRGEITLENLVKQCLRMRPDAIVIGEIRGREALDFLLAISSGHTGSGTTIHSQLENVVNRFNLLAGLAGVSRDFSRELFYSTIDVVMQCGKTADGRKIVGVKAGMNC
jgi:pilus assembly protein CpaF